MSSDYPQSSTFAQGRTARLQPLYENPQSVSKKTFVPFEFEGQKWSAVIITAPFNSIPRHWGAHARVLMLLETGSGSRIWGTKVAWYRLVLLSFRASGLHVEVEAEVRW